MRIDIVLMLYSRPEHSLAVLESLAANGVERVRAFVDHPATNQVARKQEQLLDLIAGQSGVQVNFEMAPARRGLAASVRLATSQTLATADAVIVLEDDCVVQPGGIDYFKEALHTLRGHQRIRSVCGYRFPAGLVHGIDEPILLQRFCPWGWATWRERWADYEPDLARLLGPRHERLAQTARLPASVEALCLSDAYLENRVDVWSVPWVVAHYLSDTYAVYPPSSVIQNIGFDGSGTNCIATDVFMTPPALMPRLKWTNLVHQSANEVEVERFLAPHHDKIYPVRG